MSGIDIFAWVVLFVMIGAAVVVFVVLGLLPGRIAKEREHPQAEAINAASWLALIFGFAAWPFVLVWAYLRPLAQPLHPGDLEAAKAEDEALKAERAAAKAAQEAEEEALKKAKKHKKGESS
jgi:Zn-dependent protease with chaperone function